MGSVTFYSSGLGRSINDFRGVADAGHPACISMSDVSSSVLEAAREFNEHGGLLLIDSGAYSVATGTLAEIDFNKVMADYRNLVDSMPDPSGLLLIAPDVLGDMDATADLQTRHLDQMAEIGSLGASWLVPFQRGWDKTPQRYADHARVIQSSLGRFVVGVPMKISPWPLPDLSRMVAAVKPFQLHLLGLGVRAKRLQATIGAVWGACAATHISHDATRIAAQTGTRGKGRFLTNRPKALMQEHILSRLEDYGLAGICAFYADHLGYDYDPCVHAFAEFPEIDDALFEQLFTEFDYKWDDTEDLCDMFHSPGFFTPAEARALAKTFGLTCSIDLDQWAEWSQEAPDEAFRQKMLAKRRWYAEDESDYDYGCKLGYLLAEADISGHCWMLRDPRRLVDVVRIAYQDEHREEVEFAAQKLSGQFRRQAVRELSQAELAKPASMAVQTAFGF